MFFFFYRLCYPWPGPSFYKKKYPHVLSIRLSIYLLDHLPIYSHLINYIHVPACIIAYLCFHLCVWLPAISPAVFFATSTFQEFCSSILYFCFLILSLPGFDKFRKPVAGLSFFYDSFSYVAVSVQQNGIFFSLPVVYISEAKTGV